MIFTAASVKQEDVIAWIKDNKPNSRILYKSYRNGDIGPDLVLQIKDRLFFFEAIAFTEKPKGKNQSDFWKAFSQAIARLSPNSIAKYGEPDRVIIALPINFWRGWRERTGILGNDVWKSIGHAFPKLYIWFVGDSAIKEYTWNESYDAVRCDVHR